MGANIMLVPETLLPSFVSFQLREGVSIIGRSLDCDFVVKHQTISRRHAEITVRDDRMTIRDLGSHNGTFVDSKRICESRPIVVGQRVGFGTACFLLAPSATDEDVLSASEGTVPIDQGKNGAASLNGLSSAENRVLEQILNGMDANRVAEALQLSPNTVHNHMRAIYKKFGVHGARELVTLFVPRHARSLTSDSKSDPPTEEI
jgi:DNA-binding CsgD family transcriptional regulator